MEDWQRGYQFYNSGINIVKSFQGLKVYTHERIQFKKLFYLIYQYNFMLPFFFCGKLSQAGLPR